MKIIELTDRDVILDWLEADRLYNAYAIGDLEPEWFAQSTWAAAVEEGEQPALALLFRGLDPPALFLSGESTGLHKILVAGLFPEHVYITCREELLPMTRMFYTWEQIIPMWRMVLEPQSFHAVNEDCIGLTQDNATQIAELYSLGGGTGYNPSQIEHGVFYGITDNGQLISIAGTHIVSRRYNIGAVGNIVTHPEFRGRGCGTKVTSAVISELLRLQIRDIVLNVEQDNAPALRMYEKLGFERYCPFIEGAAILL